MSPMSDPVDPLRERAEAHELFCLDEAALLPEEIEARDLIRDLLADRASLQAAAHAYLDATSSRPVAVERARQFLRDSASLPDGSVYVVCGYCHNSDAHSDACPVSIITALLS